MVQIVECSPWIAVLMLFYPFNQDASPLIKCFVGIDCPAVVTRWSSAIGQFLYGDQKCGGSLLNFFVVVARQFLGEISDP